MSKKDKKEVLVPLDLPGATKVEKAQALWAGTVNELGTPVTPGWYGCTRCELCNFRTSPDVVFADGSTEAKIMIIGEAPGAEEEAARLPFIGPSGKLMNQILCQLSDDVGMQELWKWYNKPGNRNAASVQDFHKKVFEWRDKEFFITNVVACRPPENGTPTRIHTQACWERVLNLIYIVDPILIIASGATAAATVAQRNFEITKYRGQLHDIEIPGRSGKMVKYPMMPTLHPSYLLRRADYKDLNGDYAKTVRDFASALKIVDRLKNQYYGTPIPERIWPDGV
jgi:uracil-DNA glycosylase family 4